jgi:RNA polymerase nonessential primary-like sigma factor
MQHDEFSPPLLAADDDGGSDLLAFDAMDDTLESVGLLEHDAPARSGTASPPDAALDRDEELRLVAAAQQGDKAAREALVRANQRSVAWIARRYRASGVPQDDLVSEGTIGVLTAIDRFDGSRGARFETYARWWILDSVRNCVLRQSRTVRLPANVVKEIGSIDRLLAGTGAAEASQGRRVVIDRIAQRLQRSAGHVEQMLALREPARSIDALADEPHEIAAGEEASPMRWSPEAIAAMKQMLSRLGTLMDGLSEKERTVLIGRYGLADGEVLSLETLGAQLGLTAERVRQIQNEAIARLRARFAAQGLVKR